MHCKFPKCLLIGISLLFFAACTFSPPTPTPIQLEITGQDRVQFEGRGAGAGMMLSASMGAMGVALGVAIDEGIAKELGQTADAAGVVFPLLLQQELARFYRAHNRALHWVESESAELQVRLNHYGFKTLKGDNDQVVAAFDWTLTEGEKTCRFRAPFYSEEDLGAGKADSRAKAGKPDSVAFGVIKTSATDIERLWRTALKQSLQRAVKDCAL